MKEDTITLPLGFRFVVGNDVVEVQKGNYFCEHCAFLGMACDLGLSYLACSSSLRSDGEDVSFVKVGEVKP